LCLQTLAEAKRMLLCCATPESIVRLENSTLPAAARHEIEHIYFKEQCHENVFEFLHHVFVKNRREDSLHLQVCDSCLVLHTGPGLQCALIHFFILVLDKSFTCLLAYLLTYLLTYLRNFLLLCFLTIRPIPFSGQWF